MSNLTSVQEYWKQHLTFFPKYPKVLIISGIRFEQEGEMERYNPLTTVKNTINLVLFFFRNLYFRNQQMIFF